jgi:hypothetical protein
MLNGEKVGNIARDDILEIAAPAGKATIEASIDWGRSQPLTIDTKPGETVEVEVRNRWGGVLAIWAITFGRNSYLASRQCPPASTSR